MKAGMQIITSTAGAWVVSARHQLWTICELRSSLVARSPRLPRTRRRDTA
jgi:hypothetical protein